MGRKKGDAPTEKQLEILSFIKEYTLKKGFPPSVREICEAVDLRSTSSVHAHLKSLERLGLISRDNLKSRTIEILDDEFAPARRELSNIPVIGQVAAGQPILAEENITEYFPIPVDYLPNKETFMLKIKGDSMINAGIFNGDHILVECCSTASNGEIVVALVEDGATVKRFYKENGYYRLQPENDTMDPIIVENVTILGKVIGLFRLMR
ncbi:MAG: transcriptional repressor LexA [Lachnospiraceae bacterium]|nr:transcriptional repressor LexA [Lachnospiraceae bacterium]